MNDLIVHKYLAQCPRSPGWVYTPGKDKNLVHFLSCKSRQCEKCGYYWSWKWRQLLLEKQKSDARLNKPVISRAITLTTAYDPGYQKVWYALKIFWRIVRENYPNLQYWGVTEYNQKHTQPHFHFILSDDTYIPQVQLTAIWEKAQEKAGFEKIAYKVWIEKIRSNIQAYFTKYLTKLTGGKDEIPKPENWRGRYVRYSRKFFDFPVPIIYSALLLNRAIEADNLSRSYFLIGPKLNFDWGAMIEFKLKSDKKEKAIKAFLEKEFDIVKDREKGKFVLDDIDIQLEFSVK